MIETHVTDEGATRSLTFSKLLPATPSEVYRAFTNATALRDWLADQVHVAAQEGGAIFLGWNRPGYYVAGRYTRLKPNKHVAFDWQGIGEPGRSEVEVDIEQRQNGTEVTLVHRGLGAEASWDGVVDEVRDGWLTALENLHAYFDVGQDLRIARRPFLGIIMAGAMTPEDAERLGLPSTDGVFLSGTVAGTGAEAAGLQNRDVIVGMAGRPVRYQSDLTAILDEHLAGDVLELEFYRDGVKRTAVLRLSERPLPEVPDSPGELARRVEEMYGELGRELDRVLDGASDKDAGKRPGKGQWSAKEVLAHLIHTERDGQFWAASVISGAEAMNFPDNIDVRIVATVEAFPELDDLTRELRSLWAETVAMVRHLPDDFTSRKRDYRRIGEALLQGGWHPKEHFHQITETLAAVKNGGLF